MVSYKTTNSTWKKMWPEVVTPRDFEGFEDDPGSPTVEHIVSLGKSLGLEVSKEDVEELVEEQGAELSLEELRELQKEQQQTVAEETSSGQEKGREEVSAALMKEMCCPGWCSSVD